MTNSYVQNIINADIDAIALSQFTQVDANTMIPRRLAPAINSLDHYLQYLDGMKRVFTQQSGYVNVNGSQIKALPQVVAEAGAMTGAATAAAANAVSAAQKTINDADGLLLKLDSDARKTVEDAVAGVAVDANLITDALTVTVPKVNNIKRTQAQINKERITPYDFGAIGDGLSHKLSTKYTSLADAQVKYPLALSLDDEIDWCALQAFFDYCKSNVIVNAVLTGHYVTNKELNYVQGHGAKTKNFYGELNITPTSDMHHVLRIAGSFLNFDTIDIEKNPNLKIPYGVFIGGYLNSDSTINSTFNTIKAESFDVASVCANQNTMFCKFNNMRGTGGKVTTVNFTNAVTLSTDEVSQRTVFDVDYVPFFKGNENKLHPDDFPAPNSYLYINGQAYRIEAVDTVAKKITVFPLYVGATSGIAKCVEGAFFHHGGNNAGCAEVGTVSAIGGGGGISEVSLYTATYANVITEYCGAAISVGNNGNDPALNLNISRAYFEMNLIDYVQNSRYDATQTIMSNTVNLDSAKVFAISVTDGFAPDGNYYSTNNSGMLGSGNISLDNQQFEINNDIFLGWQVNAVRDIYLDGKMGVLQYGMPLYDLTINFKINYKRLRLLGYATLTLIIKEPLDGQKGINKPITLNAPDGWTFDGTKTQLVFNNFESAAVFQIAAGLISEQKIINVTAIGLLDAKKGVTENRPSTPRLGQIYYDTTLLVSGKPITWNGSAWVDALGVIV